MKFLATYLSSFAGSFVRKDEGQDLLEYALLVALIAIVCIVGVGVAGGNINDMFNGISEDLFASEE